MRTDHVVSIRVYLKSDLISPLLCPAIMLKSLIVIRYVVFICLLKVENSQDSFRGNEEFSYRLCEHMFTDGIKTTFF